MNEYGPRLALVGFAMSGLVGCAVGLTTSDTDGSGGGLLTGAGGGPSGMTSQNASQSSGQGAAPSGSSGQGGNAGDGGQGGDGGEAPNCMYDSPNMCSSAEALGSLAGDESAPAKTASGVTSKWFKIHITEEVSSIFESDLSYTVTLSSPPNMDFDLFVHEGPQDGNPDCNAPPKKGTPSGNDETVSAMWDDSQGLGGKDDSVWLNIEVRYISGMECDAAATWQLSVKGHT